MPVNMCNSQPKGHHSPELATVLTLTTEITVSYSCQFTICTFMFQSIKGSVSENSNNYTVQLNLQFQHIQDAHRHTARSNDAQCMNVGYTLMTISLNPVTSPRSSTLLTGSSTERIQYKLLISPSKL